MNPSDTDAEPTIALTCLKVQTWAFNAIYHRKESGLLFSNLGAAKVLSSWEDFFNTD